MLQQFVSIFTCAFILSVHIPYFMHNCLPDSIRLTCTLEFFVCVFCLFRLNYVQFVCLKAGFLVFVAWLSVVLGKTSLCHDLECIE